MVMRFWSINTDKTSAAERSMCWSITESHYMCYYESHHVNFLYNKVMYIYELASKHNIDMATAIVLDISR